MKRPAVKSVRKRKGMSNEQIGMIGQMEFAKLGTVGSNGALDYANPYADDDGRDHEIHRRGRFGADLAVQTKIAMSLHVHRRSLEFGARITFGAGRRVRSARMFWYFFAYISPATMRVQDPCFLIPSAVVHQRCRRNVYPRRIELVFKASMEADSRDKWAAYQCSAREVGRRLMAIIADLEPGESLQSRRVVAQDFPGAVLVRRRRS